MLEWNPLGVKKVSATPRLVFFGGPFTQEYPGASWRGIRPKYWKIWSWLKESLDLAGHHTKQRFRHTHLIISFSSAWDSKSPSSTWTATLVHVLRGGNAWKTEDFSSPRTSSSFYKNFCHAFYTWASGSDMEGNLIPRFDINKLIDFFKNLFYKNVEYGQNQFKNMLRTYTRLRFIQTACPNLYFFIFVFNERPMCSIEHSSLRSSWKRTRGYQICTLYYNY